MAAVDFNNVAILNTDSNSSAISIPAPNVLELKLGQSLNTTLILDELLAIYQQQLEQEFSIDGFHYRYNNFEYELIDYQANSLMPVNRCNYKLEVEDKYLGDITVSRRQKFSESEIQLLESSLNQLSYPLRNSILYKQALNAALHDTLTGLGSRALYQQSLAKEVSTSHRHQQALSMVVIDIDHFKGINDTYGHASGDHALLVLANIISENTRESDMAFRFGGDEFILLLNQTDLVAAKTVLDRIRTTVEKTTISYEDKIFTISVSIGTAQLTEKEEGSQLFNRADQALLEAKAAGRNQIKLATA